MEGAQSMIHSLQNPITIRNRQSVDDSVMYELNFPPQDIDCLLEGLLFSRLALAPADDPPENHD
jgi:hypothetical protein